MTTIAGFGPVSAGLPEFILSGSGINEDVSAAITDAIIEVSIAGASTITLEMTDPKRTILNSGVFEFGTTIVFDGLVFQMVQLTKQNDMLEAVFESQVIYQLSQQIGVTAAYTSTDVGTFVAQLCRAVPNNGVVIDPTPAVTAQTISRGTSEDPIEDSWTCITRLATTIGWRAFEYKGVIYFCSDPYLLQQPNQGTIQEFTPNVMNIDFDWDTLKPFGDMTVTAMTATWVYPPGSPITVANLGPPSGTWLVKDCQRDIYSPQCSIALTVPLTPQEQINLQEEDNAGDSSTG